MSQYLCCRDLLFVLVMYWKLSSPSPKSQSPKSQSQDQRDLGWHNNHIGHHHISGCAKHISGCANTIYPAAPSGTGSESRGRKGNRRVGRQPNARFFRAERGLALQRKAQSLIRPMETHQINNYLEVERADSICWEKFERQFVEKVIFKNLEHSWHFCSMLG